MLTVESEWWVYGCLLSCFVTFAICLKLSIIKCGKHKQMGQPGNYLQFAVAPRSLPGFWVFAVDQRLNLFPGPCWGWHWTLYLALSEPSPSTSHLLKGNTVSPRDWSLQVPNDHRTRLLISTTVPPIHPSFVKQVDRWFYPSFPG